MLRHVAGGVLAGIVITLSGGVSLAAAPATPVVSEITATCDAVTPRTEDELVALATAGLAEHGAAWQSAALAVGTPGRATMVRLEAAWVGTPEVPAGAPADQATTRAVVEALATYIACNNDGDLAAVAAFWPDAFVENVLGSITYGWARLSARGVAVDPATIDPAQTRETVQRFLASSDPRDPTARQTLLAVTDVRDRGDGVVTATMLLTQGDGDPVALGVTLIRTATGWRFQDLPYSIDPPPPAP